MRPLNLTLEQITFNALDSLARHKPMMFGYWAAILVYERRRRGITGPSPFASLVTEAKKLRKKLEERNKV